MVRHGIDCQDVGKSFEDGSGLMRRILILTVGAFSDYSPTKADFAGLLFIFASLILAFSVFFINFCMYFFCKLGLKL